MNNSVQSKIENLKNSFKEFKLTDFFVAIGAVIYFETCERFLYIKTVCLFNFVLKWSKT